MIRKPRSTHFEGASNITSGGDPLPDIFDDVIDAANAIVDLESSPIVFYVNGSTGDNDYNGLSPNIRSLPSGKAKAGPKKTIGAALDLASMFSRRHTFIKIASGTYDETLILSKHRGASVNLIGELAVEHSGQVDDYEGAAGLNPIGFHQVTVSGFTFEATDDQKWLLFYFDDGTTELVKILTVLDTDTVEVGAARLSGKTDNDYIKTGSGGHTTKVELVSEGVTVETSESQLLRFVGEGPKVPADDALYLGAFFSMFGIKFSSTNTYGSALYLSRVLGLNIFASACSFRCPDSFSMYVVSGSFDFYVYPAGGYMSGESASIYERLTGGVFSNITQRAGCYFGGSTHIYQSPTAWLNYRSCVHEGAFYTGDWQSFSLLYPRDQGLVIKAPAGYPALRTDDRGGLMMRGKILVDGPLLFKALSDVSATDGLEVEWRGSTGGVPLRIESGCRAHFPSTTFTIDNDEAGEACIEVESSPIVNFDVVTIDDAPTGVFPITIEHSHVHFNGALSAPSQDYGVAPAGGIVHVDGHSDISFKSTATGKNTNAGDSSPLVIRRLSSVCIPASGYDLKDNADGNTVYLGSAGNGKTLPASGVCKNDLVANPTATEELVVIGRD